MQSIPRALFISALFCAFLSTSLARAGVCPPSSIQQTARVAHVHDGDTLKLVDGRKIRLLGINTPEVARKHAPAEDFAYQARDALRKLVKQSESKIGLSFGIEKRDRYKRTLAHLYLADGTNLQARLIQLGFATAFTTPPNDRLSECYSRLEAIAIKHRRGIWALDQYRLIPAAQLSKNDRGFRRIQGRVLRIEQSPKAFWIHMQGNLRIRIPAGDLYNFDLYSLKQLTGKNIVVRGWVHPKAKGHFMMLRHPASLTTRAK